ncbi:MAG TPA: alpha/beta fold hydrolase [Armatimonadota bacterium]|jgi:hypothetical protein
MCCFARLRRYLLLVALVCVAVARCGADEAETKATQVAQTFITHCTKGEYTAAASAFDATMRTAIPVPQLQQVWEGITQQAGAFVALQDTHCQRVPPYTVISVICQFNKQAWGVIVACDDRGTVSGLYFYPDTPPYADLTKFHEVAVTIGTAPWALPGTLTVPNGPGPFRVVVLVHGSGANDRNETVGPNKPFRDLAWGLATQGIAVLRYEKRNYTHAAECAKLPVFTVKEETIDDAVAAVALLRTRQEIDGRNIYVLGHSLGGYLVPRIAQADGAISGFIILAGAARPLEDIILEQNDYFCKLDGKVTDDEQRVLTAAHAGAARIKDPALPLDTPAAQLFNAPACYWLDLRGYQPAERAKTLQQPLLILQGKRDYQVTHDDYLLWSAALATRPNVTMKEYDDLNHFFLPGKGRSTPAENEQPGHVDVHVVEDIAAWIAAR